METEILEKIGLTHNESIVYITLLKQGTSTTGAILNNSGLNSGKIYEILDSLERKGLVSESIINKVKHFTSAPPLEILEYLEKKKIEIKKDEELIKKELHVLEKLRSFKTENIKSLVYTGFRGIKTAANEALNSIKKGEEILGMGVTERKEKIFNDFWQGWSQRRIYKKIQAKHIFSERSEYFDVFGKMKYTKSRVLTGLTPVTVDIFGNDKVLILNYTEPYSCTIIYDKNTATSFKDFFYQLWKIAKP